MCANCDAVEKAGTSELTASEDVEREAAHEIEADMDAGDGCYGWEGDE